MRCTFYVESDVFDPWVEDLSEPPSRQMELSRQGAQWTVVDSWLSPLVGDSQSEACVVLALINNEPAAARRLHRRRKLSSRAAS
jgi:hypothetical protein